eukprot:2856253-Amphidinium_carterae.4
MMMMMIMMRAAWTLGLSIAEGAGVHAAASVCVAAAPSPLFKLSDQPIAKRRRGRPSSKLKRQLLQDFGVNVEEEYAVADDLPKAAGGERVACRVVHPPKIQIDMKKAVLQPGNRGRMVPVAFCQEMVQACRLAGQANSERDTAVENIAAYYFDPSTYHVASNVVMESLCQVSPGQLQMRLCRLAALLFMQQQYMRMMLEKRLVDSMVSANLLCYVEFVAYDETPMRLRISGANAVSTGTCSDATAEAMLSARRVQTSGGSQTLICKVLQMRTHLMMLIRVGDHYVGLCDSFYSPLVSMASNSAEVIFPCLSKHSPITSHSERFGLRTRTVCCDRAPSNKLAEEWMLSERDGWTTTMLWCEVHALAGCHVKCFDTFFLEDIQGLMNLGLCMRFDRAWHCWIEALEAELASKPLHVLPGTCTPDALNTKKLLLHYLFDGSPSCVLHCLELLSATNGDWRVGSCIQYYCGSLEVASVNTTETHKNITHSLLKCLGNSKFELWPRHRWTGFRSALRKVILVCAVHSLFRGAFNRFMSMMDREKEKVAATHDVPMLGDGVDVATTLEHSAEIATSGQVGAQADDNPLGSVGGDGSHEESWARVNQRDRSKLCQWLRSDPLPSLLVMMLCLNPLDKLREKCFVLGSASWELAQQGKVAKEVLLGQAETGGSGLG